MHLSSALSATGNDSDAQRIIDIYLKKFPNDIHLFKPEAERLTAETDPTPHFNITKV